MIEQRAREAREYVVAANAEMAKGYVSIPRERDDLIRVTGYARAADRIGVVRDAASEQDRFHLDVVSIDLARNMRGEMEAAQREGRFNLRDSGWVARLLPEDRFELPSSTPSAPVMDAARVAMANRLASSVEETTDPFFGKWRGGGMEAAQAANAAAGMASGIKSVDAAAKRAPDALHAAYDVASTALAVDLIRHVRTSLGKGHVRMDDLRDPSLYLASSEQRIAGVEARPTSMAKGPRTQDSGPAPMMTADRGR